MAITSEPWQCEGSAGCSANWILHRRCGSCMDVVNVPYQHYYTMVQHEQQKQQQSTQGRQTSSLCTQRNERTEAMNEGMNEWANKKA